MSTHMEETETSSKTLQTSKLKIAGSWSGVLEVDLQVWTLPMLREEVAKQSNCAPNCINLICGGKILKDGDGNPKLAQLGLKNNSRILTSRVSIDQEKALKDAEEERSRRLARIGAAADALSKRHVDCSLPLEDFNIELEDQSGQKVQLGSENDKRGVMMGLMLHANAKQLIKKNKYKDALDVLSMGEEAFSLCNPKVIEMIDNVPILQLDMVWCYFLLRDISWLSMAGVRLAKAREGIDLSYGKDCTRIRLLQVGRHPELAIYLRLELLEGVVAYHSGCLEKSQIALTSAQDRYHQLQVPDEALSLLMSMGFTEEIAKKAIRLSNQDGESALVEGKESIASRNQEDIQQRNEIMEQKMYGVMPIKKAVDLERLNELVSRGFEKLLAAEALRRNENDTQKALDELTNLTNSERNALLQHYIESKKRKRRRQVLEADIEELVSMGFERLRVTAALQASSAKDRALSLLVAGQIPNLPPASNNDLNSSSSPTNDMNSSVPLGNGTVRCPSGISNIEERDEEKEDEVAQELTGDPLADYDIEVTIAGEAIAEYLTLLAATANANGSNKNT